MGRRIFDHLAAKTERQLAKSEAAMQDAKDLRRKGQVRREDKLGLERMQENVNTRMKDERRRLEAFRAGRIPEKEG